MTKIDESRDAIAVIANKFGDPEEFAERELQLLVDIQKMPIGTKLYTHDHGSAVGAEPDARLWAFFRKFGLEGLSELPGWPSSYGKTCDLESMISDGYMRDEFDRWVGFKAPTQPSDGHGGAVGALKDLIYDGYRVYSALSGKAKQRTSADNVSDVLDALAALTKNNPINQCDGCRVGLPVENGIHRSESYGAIACTAHRYQPSDDSRRGDAVAVGDEAPAQFQRIFDSALVKAAIEKAIKDSWGATDPYCMTGTPGSYWRGHNQGLIDGIKTVKSNYEIELKKLTDAASVEK